MTFNGDIPALEQKDLINIPKKRPITKPEEMYDYKQIKAGQNNQRKNSYHNHTGSSYDRPTLSPNQRNRSNPGQKYDRFSQVAHLDHNFQRESIDLIPCRNRTSLKYLYNNDEEDYPKSRRSRTNSITPQNNPNYYNHPHHPKLITAQPSENQDQLRLNQFMQNRDKSLFTSNDKGKILQWSTRGQHLIHDWGKAHDGGVHLIAVSDDGEHLFTASWYGDLKQWSIRKQRLIKDYGRIHEGFINSIIITRNSEYVFTTSRYGF